MGARDQGSGVGRKGSLAGSGLVGEAVAIAAAWYCSIHELSLWERQSRTGLDPRRDVGGPGVGNFLQ